jgi:hypothetical protein
MEKKLIDEIFNMIEKYNNELRQHKYPGKAVLVKLGSDVYRDLCKEIYQDTEEAKYILQPHIIINGIVFVSNPADKETNKIEIC